ncbi:DUF4199 domain-containing protein [Peijinzhouia sedimentorum]|tara:strand:- start:804 stop:1316 length:513 start_codon:yes stop_codon:yes gene_type:complete
MEERPSISSLGMRYGGIVGLIGVIISVIFLITSSSTQNPAQWITVLILIGGIVMAHREFKNSGNGFMSFGEGFRLGFMVVLISTIINSIIVYVYLKFIDGSSLIAAREQALMQMESQGGGANNPAAEMIDLFTSAEAVLVMALIFSLIFGVIISLIIAAITKKDEPEFGM